MIRVLTGMPAGLVGVGAGGELTAEDHSKVLAPALAAVTMDASRAGEWQEAIAWAAAIPEQR